MVCPKCGSKTQVKDNSHNYLQQEMYRERVCKSCCHKFYTVEIEIEDTPEFREDYLAGHRYLKRFRGWAKKNTDSSEEPNSYELSDVTKRLAQFEAIGMEPDKLEKAAKLYKAAKEIMADA